MRISKLLENGYDLKRLTKKYNEQVLMMTAGEMGAADINSIGLSAVGTAGAATRNATVAVIPVLGVLTRYGDGCGNGDEWIAQQINAACANDGVSGIVLKIDSPGGQIGGTKMLAAAVQNATKPVVAHVVEKCASKALWVASACAEIHIEDTTGMQLGCVGAMTILASEAEKLAKENIKPIVIRSKNTPDKNAGNSIEGWTEKQIAEIEAAINAMGTEFENVLKTNRPNIATEALTGKTYDGKQAIKLGLADRVCSLQDSVNRVAFLARKK